MFRCAGVTRGHCDYEAAVKWCGRCPQCGWNYNILGEAPVPGNSRTSLATLAVKKTVYHPTGLKEVDHVLGGGLVRGSVVLFGGSRGAGKSSLLISVADGVANERHNVLYASGEESAQDVGKIAHRLNVHNEKIEVMGNACDVDDVISRAEALKSFLIVFDSLQVLTCDDVKGSEGSAAQGVAVANIITGFCKRTETCAIIVNHVTRSGEFAGSMEVEHLVDTILTLEKNVYAYDEDDEDEPTDPDLRLLLVDKNRNGPENQKAYFAMTAEGLKPVRKRSKLER